MSVEKSARRTWGGASEGALAGAVAALLAVGIEIGVRTLSGLPSPIELLGDQGTRFIPGPIFEFLLSIFGHTAKYLYFTGIFIAQVVGLALLTALAFAMRGLVIRRRALAAVADAEEESGVLSADTAQSEPAEEANVGEDEDEDQDDEDEEDELPNFSGRPDYTPAELAALAAAVPTIQKPVGWWFSAALAGLAWVLSGILVLPVIGAGLFGSNLPVGSAIVAISLLVPAIAFGALLPLSQQALRWLAPRLIGSPTLQRTFSPSRRLFLKRVTIGLAILGVGALAWRFIAQGLSNGNAAGANSLDGPPPPERLIPPPIPTYGAWKDVKNETPELTSSDQFYYVSKNVYTDPSIDASLWRLTVDGEGVEHPFTLSYQDVINLPAVEQITTLECISNEVGGNLMSSARWKGVPLKDLLERAGIKPGATKVAFHAADEYTDSIHLTKALDPLTLLAYLMNDQPLAQPHGFPARMIVPGIYGMKHCKWITRIEVVNYNFLGYWQQEGWNDDAIINPTARIDVPFPDATLPVNRQTSIAGVAFAGAKGVSAVDVSTDNGRTWRRATLKKPLGAVTWTLWELPWTPTSQDTYALVARMIDLQGYYQQPVVAEPYPNGASGYDRIYVTVT
ncbi:MAG TPA: molybdopterin-dependent oxidoreductase [Ktedonobacterales bacterium]|nr:molybdopterin-dependent oxidoreductase [Ktedonobacterales bacterium]